MNHTVHLYTDGTCSPNPGEGGWACILLHPATMTHRFLAGYEPRTTNNRMELVAALNGLEALTRPRCRVTVYSDSQYLVRGAEEHIHAWERKGFSGVKNDDLWKLLRVQVMLHEVRFVWVRGHDGNEYNEQCDQLARRALIEKRRLDSRIDQGRGPDRGVDAAGVPLADVP